MEYLIETGRCGEISSASLCITIIYSLSRLRYVYKNNNTKVKI